MLHILRHYRPEVVCLLFTPEVRKLAEADERYEKVFFHLKSHWDGYAPVVLEQDFSVSDVSDMDELDQPLHDVMNRLSREYADAEILVNITSGTPQMQMLLSQMVLELRYHARGIQVKTPEKKAGTTVRTNDSENYDIDLEIECNEDEQEGAPNRCVEPELFSVRRKNQWQQVEALLNQRCFRGVAEMRPAPLSRRELARSRRPDRRALEGGRLRHRCDVRLLPGGRGLEGAGAPRRGHILHGGPVRGAPVPQRLGLPRGHPRIKRTRKPGAPSRARHKGAPRRRHALGRGRGRHGVSPPSGFGAARVPGWEDVHGDWHGCLRAFRGREMTVTLVIGAAASGKSAYAESLCLGHDGPRVYLATMEPFGEDGARRIARHRALREGKGFSTLECSRDVGAAAPGLPRGCTLLLEDVGNLVANELFAEGGLSPRDPDAAAREVLGGIERLAQAAAYTVVVTVDVFADGMRYDEGTEAWRRALARVNAGVAALADHAVEVVCGIPVWMKGEGPTR